MGVEIRGDVPKVPRVNGTDKVVRAYQTKPYSSVQGKKDDITISEGAKDYNMVMKVLKNVPEIREEKIKELLTKMESGEYSVSDKDVADKLIENLQPKSP